MSALTRRELLTAMGVAAAGIAVSCAADNAWDDLRNRLRGPLLRPGQPDFAPLTTPRNLRFAATVPAAVALCADADDVATAIRWARKTNTPFAIRGGGHNYARASSTDGLLISTRTMNAATINGNSLRAGAGVRNADLAALLPRTDHGRLLLPGGNCPGVGVAGLTLGGGIGPNAPWAGLTADRLRTVTLVTAAGDIVTASGAENVDVFWALRGGAGGNFGVVTDMEFELVEVPTTPVTTAEIVVTGRDAALATALAFQGLRHQAERIATGNLYLGHSQDGVEAVLTTQILADERNARDLLTRLLAIPGVHAEITQRSWWDAYGWYVTPPSPAYSFWDRSLYADDFLSGEVLSAALDVVARFPAGAERYGAMGLYGWVGGAVHDVEAAATAYVHRRARVLVEMSAGWPTPPTPGAPVTAIPDDIRGWEEELWETLLPHTTGRSYQNFPDPELPDWATAYYGDNLGRLSQVKATWDPGGLFTYPQSVPQAR